jgi:DNA polymerase eta
MSSSQPFIHSSSTAIKKSRFTFKHLSQLHLYSTACPLRVIAHIDLDAFYAQCEGIRLNISEDQPLAVQQWQGLIAINYPARKFGLNRHIDIKEAKRLCPELIMQHVATWREGDEKWAYHEDAFKNISSQKVSLDPYRLESRKILNSIKNALPAPPLQKVEKASIDEVFLDLSSQVHSILLERYPELHGPPPYDDPTENLPSPPTTALDWTTDALVDLDTMETENDDPDWDDITMLIASEIVRHVRASIREQLKYTCSAGIAHNKMLAKLGSAYRKPNQQTIIRNRAIHHFLSDVKFTKIRNLGGKLGDQIVDMFKTETVNDLLDIPVDQLKTKVGDDTGSWVYQVIRGIDSSEVNTRTQIKSMLSAKSFRPSINSFEQAVRWLRIFVADIFTRLIEEGVLENRRRPKTITLHHRQAGQTRSRQSPIPQGRQINEEGLFDLSRNLLSQVVAEGTAWPCANLSLSVGGFEDGPTGNKGIGPFLVKGEEARSILSSGHENSTPLNPAGHLEKRRKLDNEGGIEKFLARRNQGALDHHSNPQAPIGLPPADTNSSRSSLHDDPEISDTPNEDLFEARLRVHPDSASSPDAVVEMHPPQLNMQNPTQRPITTYFCPQCSKDIPAEEKEEHRDWHFAKTLQEEERTTSDALSTEKPTSNHEQQEKLRKGSGKKTSVNSSGSNAGGKVEKGQSRLAFG